MIDCQTGIVLHKYKAPGEVRAQGLLLRCWGWAADPILPGLRPTGLTSRTRAALLLVTPTPPPPPPRPQEFFSVAWTALTVVTQAGHKKRWSVLAAAGLRGLVRLLHVRAGFCCGVIRAHKKAIATLCFSPTHETHLFSKSLSPTRGVPSTLSCSLTVRPPQDGRELLGLAGFTLGRRGQLWPG